METAKLWKPLEISIQSFDAPISWFCRRIDIELYSKSVFFAFTRQRM